MKNQNNAAKTQGVEAGKTDNVREIVQNLTAVAAKVSGLPFTIKTVEELFKKIQHRNRLEAYIDKLKTFKFKKTEEDLEPVNYYHGCQIEIKDDNNNVFQLRHPAVIKEVIEFMAGRFDARLTEIEAEIILPTQTAA